MIRKQVKVDAIFVEIMHYYMDKITKVVYRMSEKDLPEYLALCFMDRYTLKVSNTAR